VRRNIVLLVVSHYRHDIPCKKYNYVFQFVKVMTKVLSVPFFLDMEKGILMTSSLRDVVPVLMGTFYHFSVTRIVRMIHKLSKVFLYLSKLWPKYYRFFFSGTQCICTYLYLRPEYLSRGGGACRRNEDRNTSTEWAEPTSIVFHSNNGSVLLSFWYVIKEGPIGLTFAGMHVWQSRPTSNKLLRQ